MCVTSLDELSCFDVADGSGLDELFLNLVPAGAYAAAESFVVFFNPVSKLNVSYDCGT